MAERINERLAKINASRVQNNTMDDSPEDYTRPFTPTDHSLTARPRFESLGLFKAARSVEPILNEDNKELSSVMNGRSTHFRKYFPNQYVDYIEAEPETMQFDQTLATDKSKQETMAKEFISRNKHRMWMYHTEYLGKTHGAVLREMVSAENFPGLMDELRLKERKHLRGSGSESVLGCMTMKKELIKADFRNDNYLGTLETSRTSRRDKMERLVLQADKTRIKEYNRVSYFKGH